MISFSSNKFPILVMMKNNRDQSPVKLLLSRASQGSDPRCLVIGQGIILYLFLTKGADSLPTLTQGQEPFSIVTFLFYSSLVFVQYISGVSASSDSKRDSHGFWGLYGGNVVGLMMTALLGGLSASLFKDLNPFVAASQLTDSSLLLLVITACVMVSMISIY
ncbi:hypothetical protein [Rossellomorea vietnamensis]|uniref:hypothetical protein n=1 Tax=Rossellomorea vietnamensis TaxID=218284 RepID=UPI001E5FD34E|nr:hypothetical protein [Rossellomorea vietnamensis]MCC5801845.1 hypothetical protein [Rossellomorea vietnamensis]